MRLPLACSLVAIASAFVVRAPGAPPRARARARGGRSRPPPVAPSGWLDGLGEGLGEGLKGFSAFQEKMGRQLRAEQAERAAARAAEPGAPKKTLFGLALGDGDGEALSEYQRAEQSFWVRKAKLREMRPKVEGLRDSLGCARERAEELLLACDGDVAKAAALFEAEAAGELLDQDESAAPESTE